ncbi:MAG: SpoIIIAH-like family protein [Oscillospiraceae bacterium]
MKKVWKRNIVVATVLLFVCGAVWLNWRYADNVAETGKKILGESTLVSSAETDGDGETADAAETEKNYFATARLSRQQARDNALALLKTAAEQEDATPEVADEASAGIAVLATYTAQEAQIENLVTAKGYADCVTFMGGDSISIVVSGDAEELSSADVAKITDIAVTETGYPAEHIKIMEAN